MPTYEYACGACKKRFTAVLTFAEHDRKRPKCPKCGSAKVAQRFGSVFTKTSRKS